MIKTKGEITISRPHSSTKGDYIKISIRDSKSFVHFLELTMTLEDFALCITGLSAIDCSLELRGLDCIGKTQEHKTLEFPLSGNLYSENRKELARKEVYKFLPSEEWIPDLYFRSQDSFFSKDNKPYARTTIRRWINV